MLDHRASLAVAGIFVLASCSTSTGGAGSGGPDDSTGSGDTTTATGEGTGSGDTSSGSTESGSGDSEDSMGSTSSDGETDTGPGTKWDTKPEPTDIPMEECPEDCYPSVDEGQNDTLWLLHLSGTTMMRVDLETGKADPLCELTGDTPPSFLTLTFSRENRLFASNGSTLYEIDSCTCETTMIGAFQHGNIYGIAPDEGEDLYGISAAVDQLVHIDIADGSTTPVGNLGVDFGTHGATWSEDEDLIYALRGSASELFDIDPQIGTANYLSTVTPTFGTVGLEMHPENGVIYGCTGTAIVYEIDPDNGNTTEVGPMGVQGCTNLGAPWDSGSICFPAG